MSNSVIILSSIQHISSQKELKKLSTIRDELAQLSTALSENKIDEKCQLLLTPIENLCKTRSSNLITLALDLLGKLISNSYFRQEHMEKVVDIINQTFTGDSTDDRVLIQIFKALQAAVTCADSPIHDSTLLKVVQTAYNIFLLSKKGPYQSVAQSILSQMIMFIFGRIPISHLPQMATALPDEEVHDDEEKELPETPETPKELGKDEIAREIVQSIVDSALGDDSVVVSLTASVDPEILPVSRVPVLPSPAVDPLLEVHFRDAYLVFRALCRLSMKPLPVLDSSSSSKREAHLVALRSKILSLELLGVIVREHFSVVSSTFLIAVVDSDLHEPLDDETSPTVDKASRTSFIIAVKHYLCVSLSRNSVSLVPEVLERSLDIFIRLVLGMKAELKVEIEVFLNEIFLVGLEGRSTFYHQKMAFVRAITTLLSFPQTLVELYLNYDCDPQALDNLFEKIVSIMARMLTNRDLKLLQLAPPLPPGEIGLDIGGFGISGTPANSGAAMLSASSSGAALSPPTLLNRPKRSNSGASLADSSVAESVPTNASNASQPSPPVNMGTLNPFLLVPASSTLGLNPLPLDRDQSLKWRALECLATILQSMVFWVHKPEPVYPTAERSSDHSSTPGPLDDDPTTAVNVKHTKGLSHRELEVEDLARFENAKNLKQAVRQGVQFFNWKYKKGISHLLAHGVMKNEPASIAEFLLSTPGLDKRMMGEYLGEGDEFNIKVMHAFVEGISFEKMGFVEGLKSFLQRFRLPGEAQKIDRFMLKFAERYMLQNPGTFTNADTAYVLAYSTIMLNTDLHNPQIKKRMSKAEFLKNNRGINDGKDLPAEFLEEIFDSILKDEIKMKDEHEKLAERQVKRSASSEFEQMSDQKKKETMFQVSEQIAQRSEQVFKDIASSKAADRKGVAPFPFYVARHIDHIRPMFEANWFAIIAGISNSLQESDTHDFPTVQLALYAFKSCIHLASVFDLETARNAFISTLTKSSQISAAVDLLYLNKNLDALRALLEIAFVDGNGLGGSWLDVFRCITTTERLLSAVGNNGNVELGGAIPASSDNKNSKRVGGKAPGEKLNVQEEMMLQSIAQNLTIGMDRIFSGSARLNGVAIVAFVKWLCVVSMEEIQQSTSSSPLNAVPRMYSLTKLVEISYYNMGRIRLEWSNIWAILGDHFNQVGCHPNQHVAIFAVDSLRQLSMKFLEKEELSNFKFQKDFLKPFEHILSHHPSNTLKDMVLRCIHQIIHAKSQNIKSGWKSIFAVLHKGAKDREEALVAMAFDLLKFVHERYFVEVLINCGMFPDYVSCLVEFSRNLSFPKINLQSVEMLRSCSRKIVSVLDMTAAVDKKATVGESLDNLSTGETSILSTLEKTKNVVMANNKDDPVLQLWFPIHFGLYEMIMNCDLEVRTRALKYLFEILKEHGQTYTTEFWDVLARGVLFPIFDDLRLTKAEQRKFRDKEEMTVWLNTTLIQALRQLVELFSYSFNSLESTMLDGVLDLIVVCFSVKQGNSTLSRIGSSCLEQLIIGNAEKLTDFHWDKVIAAIETLFVNTRADNLFDQAFVDEVYSLAEKQQQQGSAVTTVSSDRKHVREMSVESKASENDVTSNRLRSLNRNTAGSSKADMGNAPDMTRSATNLNQREDEPDDASSPMAPTSADKKGIPVRIQRESQVIIMKCVLQLAVLKSVGDVLTSKKPSVYKHMKSKHLLHLLNCCEESHKFAARFNANMSYRVALFKIDFMSNLPNLLRQETLSVQCLMPVLFNMYADAFTNDNDPLLEAPGHFDLKADRLAVVAQIEERLSVASQEILSQFNTLEATVKKRNVITWTPVVVLVLQGLLSLNDDLFQKHIRSLYADIIQILAQHDLVPELRIELFSILARVDGLWGVSNKK